MQLISTAATCASWSCCSSTASCPSAEVAERLGMTASTCWRRVSRLEEQGVIRRRVALLDREKLGLPVMVFSHVKVAGHGRDALLRFEQAVRAHAEILECYTLMGETDFLLRIVCRDIKAYEAFFLDHLSRFPGCSRSTPRSRWRSSRRPRRCRCIPVSRRGAAR